MTRVIRDSGIRKVQSCAQHKSQDSGESDWNHDTQYCARNRERGRGRGRQPQCKKTKTAGLTKKSAALYAHHSFKVHFFDVQLRDYDVKPLNATFYTGREQTTKNFPVSF